PGGYARVLEQPRQAAAVHAEPRCHGPLGPAQRGITSASTQSVALVSRSTKPPNAPAIAQPAQGQSPPLAPSVALCARCSIAPQRACVETNRAPQECPEVEMRSFSHIATYLGTWDCNLGGCWTTPCRQRAALSRPRSLSRRAISADPRPTRRPVPRWGIRCGKFYHPA